MWHFVKCGATCRAEYLLTAVSRRLNRRTAPNRITGLDFATFVIILRPLSVLSSAPLFCFSLTWWGGESTAYDF